MSFATSEFYDTFVLDLENRDECQIYRDFYELFVNMGCKNEIQFSISNFTENSNNLGTKLNLIDKQYVNKRNVDKIRNDKNVSWCDNVFSASFRMIEY